MNQIIWERWKDPLLPNLKRHQAQQEEDEEGLLNSLHDFDDDDDGFEYAQRRRVGPCIVSPMGIVPITEANLPSKLYKFWMGHTNFDLTNEVQSKISGVTGVETLNIYTRYRFRLGVGKAFDARDVQAAIEAICQPPIPKPKKEDVPFSAMRKALSKKFKFWAILVFPDDIVNVAGGDSPGEVLSKLSNLGQSESISTILSWESNDKETTRHE